MTLIFIGIAYQPNLTSQYINIYIHTYIYIYIYTYFFFCIIFIFFSISLKFNPEFQGFYETSQHVDVIVCRRNQCQRFCSFFGLQESELDQHTNILNARHLNYLEYSLLYKALLHKQWPPSTPLPWQFYTLDRDMKLRGRGCAELHTSLYWKRVLKNCVLNNGSKKKKHTPRTEDE
jgi:hypothetical protein